MTSEPVKLTFWTVPFYINVPGVKTTEYGDWERYLAAEFHTLHPNVTIEVEVVEFDAIAAKVTAALAGGVEPDIYFDDSVRHAVWAKEDGVVEDIRTLVSPETLAAINPTFVDLVTTDGVVAQLPNTASAFGILECNKALFDEASATFPEDGTWTVTEFEAAMSKIAKSGSRWPIVARVADELADYDWLSFFYAFGAKPFNAELTQSTLGSQDGVDALTWLVGLDDRGWMLPGSTTIAFGDVDNAFYAGQLVCRGGRANHIARAEKAKSEGKITGSFESAIALYPNPDAGKPNGGLTFVSGYQVFKQDDPNKRTAAKAFLEFLSQPKYAAAVAGQGFLSALTDPGPVPPETNPALAASLSKMCAWQDQFGVVDHGQKAPHFYECRLARVSLMQQALLGERGPADALTELDKQCTAALAAP
jgi:ABC-type glycerol-3-phosphate transport system substrate-binding protein